ncbi:MAG: hypothetical protein EOP04_00170 [Proteobacteria bacterium]|nr:MAG: hypothetical protein EOP04_00170 [Pseudomonadota bacterium]
MDLRKNRLSLNVISLVLGASLLSCGKAQDNKDTTVDAVLVVDTITLKGPSDLQVYTCGVKYQFSTNTSNDWRDEWDSTGNSETNYSAYFKDETIVPIIEHEAECDGLGYRPLTSRKFGFLSSFTQYKGMKAVGEENVSKANQNSYGTVYTSTSQVPQFVTVNASRVKFSIRLKLGSEEFTYSKIFPAD